MTSDPGFERRVARLENETESIYDLLAEVKSVQDAHGNKLQHIEGRLDRHTAQLDRHTAQLDRHTEQLDRHTAHFQNIEATLDEVLRRLPEPS
jgi:chromosome segregation ATPase